MSNTSHENSSQIAKNLFLDFLPFLEKDYFLMMFARILTFPGGLPGVHSLPPPGRKLCFGEWGVVVGTKAWVWVEVLEVTGSQRSENDNWLGVLAVGHFICMTD